MVWSQYNILVKYAEAYGQDRDHSTHDLKKLSGWVGAQWSIYSGYTGRVLVGPPEEVKLIHLTVVVGGKPYKILAVYFCI